MQSTCDVTVRAMPGSVVLDLSGELNSSAAGVLLSPARHVAAFEPSGMASGAANVTQVFSRGTIQRQLILSRLGRIRVN